MKRQHKSIAFCLLGLLLVGAASWLWFTLLEKKWEALPHFSSAARENPMLAASRLLARHGHEVKNEQRLREALLQPAPQFLLLAETSGVMTPQQTEQLLKWVREGTVLVMRPGLPKSSDRDPKAARNRDSRHPGALDDNPIASRYGVALEWPKPVSDKDGVARKKDEADDEQAEEDGNESEKDEARESAATSADKEDSAKAEPELPYAAVSMPNLAYPLRLEERGPVLAARNEQIKPVLADEEGKTMRIYPEGKGYVVLMAKNLFSNHYLGGYDHGELLLALARFGHNDSAHPRRVLFVQTFGMPKWYRALWDNFQPALVGLGVVLVLLLWARMRRFGPVLPGPSMERSSLIEHIDASGRWLWKVPGGRELLLRSARQATEKSLQRRAPELLRMDVVDRIEHFAAAGRLARAELQAALLAPAAKLPNEFTRQIQTLRKLRLSHEP